MRSETLLGWFSCEQIEREIWDDKKEVYIVDEISNSAGHICEYWTYKNVGNCENKPNWPNLDYPSFYLVGRHLTFPVTIKRYTCIPCVEFVFPTLRFGQL
jgi:hypothetical protein